MITTMLRRTLPFRGLPAADLAEIARQGSARRLQTGEAAFEQGEPARRFFLVAEGRMKVTMITPEGKQVFIRLIEVGDFCGLAIVLTRNDYPATCRAVSSSQVVGWPMTFWPTLVETYPSVALRAAEAFGRHIQDVHGRMAELATAEVERRVANAVLRLARNAGRPVDEGLRIDFPLTRQDLAEMTGTTLHSVSRIVASWGAQGIVGRGRARLVVRDIEALERIAAASDA